MTAQITQLTNAPSNVKLFYPKLHTLMCDDEAPPESGIARTRKVIDRAAYEALRASIKALGLIVPLVVEQHDIFLYVRSGNQRLRALREIHADADVTVPCINVIDLKGQPAEIALAETIIHSPLHPVDKFEAFTKLVEAGNTPDVIASRFGMRRREVDQALAVGHLALEVREEWRGGNITAEVAHAFTLETDQARQSAVFKKLSKQRHIDAWNVRAELKASNHTAFNLILFVGIDNYEAAGGKVKRDLFGDKHGVDNLTLLKKLADQQLDRICTSLVNDDGWGWAVHGKDADQRYSWQRDRREPKYEGKEKTRALALRAALDELDDDNDPDGSRHDAAAEELDAIERQAFMRAFQPNGRTKFGCVVEVDQNGRQCVTHGYLKAAQRGKVLAGERNAAKPKTPAEKRKAEATKAKAAERGEVSQALDRRLTSQRHAAIKQALLQTAKANEHKSGRKLSLLAVLCGIAANNIRPDQSWNAVVGMSDKDLAAVASALDEDVLLPACRAHFDAGDYFQSSPTLYALTAIKDIKGKVAEGDLPGKAADLKALAVAEAKRWGWLPVQLRTPGYALLTGAAASKKARK